MKKSNFQAVESAMAVRRNAEQEPGMRRLYATPEQFCAIFEQDTDHLYSLALLITGDAAAAEACFLAALEDCRGAKNIFPEWARSWTRRAVVKDAIGRVNLAANSRKASANQALANASETMKTLLDLPAFERCVFAITVLERYPVRECAALLNAEAREVEEARARVLRRIADQRLLVAPWLSERAVSTSRTASSAA